MNKLKRKKIYIYFCPLNQIFCKNSFLNFKEYLYSTGPLYILVYASQKKKKKLFNSYLKKTTKFFTSKNFLEKKK